MAQPIFIFIIVQEINGEYNYTHKHIEQAEIPDTQEAINKFSENWLKGLYGIPADQVHIGGDYYLIDSGQRAVEVFTCYSITEHDYDILKKYI